jgi:pimeloyl-ACP methyl ester carboxylesterase
MTEQTNDFTPDTIVLVHGLWMTPRSWEGWVEHYEAKGYNVLTPAYPGFEIEVESLRENPDVIAKQTVPGIVDHITEIISGLDKQPVIMGHSFGGTITQLLMDRGLGAPASWSTPHPPRPCGSTRRPRPNRCSRC